MIAGNTRALILNENACGGAWQRSYSGDDISAGVSD